jgi:hypothetical protein
MTASQCAAYKAMMEERYLWQRWRLRWAPPIEQQLLHDPDDEGATLPPCPPDPNAPDEDEEG